MATSSIHIETSKPSALIHNERVFSPDYLITNDKSVNDKKHYDNKHISELENLAKIDYQKNSINNRKLPSNATLIKEAIINLESHHNLNDLEKVKDTLEKKYGYKITDISIHRDEGYIYTETKNYIMGRNQYKNLEETPHIAELDKDNKFYEWNLSNNKWVKGDEIKDYKIHYNYHAHIVMLNYDFTKHRTIRNNLKDLSKMQTLVARDLGMERGKCSSYVEAQRIGVEVQESRKRLNIKEYKVQKRKENELKKEVQELKQELYNFKEMQKSITSMELTSYEKKELHRLNSKVKNKTATIEELNKKIEELKKLTHYKEDTFKDIASALRERYNKLQNEVNELKEKKPTNENDVNENKKALEDIKKKNEELRNENSQLKLMILKLQKSLIIDFEDFEINEDKNRNGTKVNDLTFDEIKGILSNLKNEADLKETQDNLKEIIENEEKKETTVVNNIRKIF